MKKQEFDDYIDQYRTNCDNALRLSGETSSYFAEYKARKLHEWLSPQLCSSSKILDFGCGDGLMTHFVQRSFPKATLFGVDPSPKSIEAAKEQFPEIYFYTSSENSTILNFEKEQFDLIFSAGVFHHIPFKNHSGYVHELFRLLKPNGYLVLFELNPLNPLTVFTFKRNPIDRYAKMMSPLYSKRLVENHGKTRTKFYCFFPKMLSWLRFSEPFLTYLPFGALYATITKKTYAGCSK